MFRLLPELFRLLPELFRLLPELFRLLRRSSRLLTSGHLLLRCRQRQWFHQHRWFRRQLWFHRLPWFLLRQERRLLAGLRLWPCCHRRLRLRLYPSLSVCNSFRCSRDHWQDRQHCYT
jgi:hypothetical protein